jgi:hypothetical protein
MASSVMTRAVSQEHDPPHSLCLLRPRRERPRGSRAAEQRNELTPLHSITSSTMSMFARDIEPARPA